jgi:hypothetical protein
MAHLTSIEDVKNNRYDFTKAVGLGEYIMKVRATFVKDGAWWVAWCDAFPGALTQGATLGEARENLIDAIRMSQEPVDLKRVPKTRVRMEEIEI